jgi:DNA polymerase-3 subunit delta'
MARGQAAALAGWAPARVVDALLKLCHDALAQALGGTGRYFPAGSVPAGAAPAALAAWWRELQRVARHAEHPWNEPLLLEALVAQAARALAPTRRAGRVAPNPLATLPR